MKSKKSVIGLVLALGLLFSMQSLKTNTEAQVGSWIASEITDNVHVQRSAAGMAGLAGGMAGRYAATKIGAAIGTAIAPGVGTVIGAGIGIL